MSCIDRVQCSTAIAPVLAGGRYDDFEALLAGSQMLGWPSVELRLWQQWLAGHMSPQIGRILDVVAEVGTVHAPPVEQFTGFRSERAQALAILEASSEIALRLGASSLVIHAWDLRIPGFSPEAMVETLLHLHDLHPQVNTAVELIPGFTKMLPHLTKHCSHARFVVDTQWASLENNWPLLFDSAWLVTGVHVQSYLDTDEAGRIRLGRGRFGADCDVPGVVRRLSAEGLAGRLTLEPVGVPQAGLGLIRRSLEYLQEIGSC